MNDVIVRLATPDDAEAILEYLRIVGKESDNLLIDENGVPFTAEQEADFIARINSSENSRMLLAWSQEKLAGVASIQGNGRKRIAHRGEIAISVRKDFWGAGVGSMLMKELIHFAKSIRMEVLSLEVRSDNTRAIRLYEKFGFTKFGTFRRFFKIRGEYHDADYMNLYLE